MISHLLSLQLLSLQLLAACWAPQPPVTGEGEALGPVLVFVDGAVVVPSEVGAQGQALSEGRVLVPMPWTPGQPVELLGSHLRVQQTAPQQAACALLFRVGVGSQRPLAVVFPDDGALLRVDRQGQDSLWVDAWKGEGVAGTDGELAAVTPTQLPASCAAEARSGPALRLGDGRMAVVEGPITERSGETGWRVAIFR